MTELSLLAAQVRAARALLGWSQTDLAQSTNVSRSAIADFESEKRRPHDATIKVILSELAAAGVEFTEMGVAFKTYPPPKYRPTGKAG